MQNPKTHDALFKWLIASFTEEFFQHYFPQIPVGQYRFIDKEFISRYEAIKESLEDDLFLTQTSIGHILVWIQQPDGQTSMPYLSQVTGLSVDKIRSFINSLKQ